MTHVIKMLEERIKNFDYQKKMLESERHAINDSLNDMNNKIQEYVEAINEMRLAIKTLGKA